jgi:hypothetical protein
LAALGLDGTSESKLLAPGVPLRLSLTGAWQRSGMSAKCQKFFVIFGP